MGNASDVAIEEAVSGISGLVRGVELTPANVADTDVADALIMGDEEAVYADKAYESKERRKRLRARGINDRIMRTGCARRAARRLRRG